MGWWKCFWGGWCQRLECWGRRIRSVVGLSIDPCCFEVGRLIRMVVGRMVLMIGMLG